MVQINELPDEVLEFIMSHLPPYNDLDECSLVCRRWANVVHSKYIKQTTFTHLTCHFQFQMLKDT